MQFHFDFERMKERCLAQEEDFYHLGRVITTEHGPLVYRDNGSNILAVAHLDSVQTHEHNHFYVINIGGEDIVFNAQLDDRLGAYIILDLLPQLLGENYADILLTTGEELGMSTAQFFQTAKKYNWMFSFDRAGDDVVMYDYDTKELRDMLKEYGFRIGNGSFSDISYLTHLGCAGFNFGCGYENYHSPEAHAHMWETEANVSKFVDMYQQLKDTHLEYVYVEKPYKNWRTYTYGKGWSNWRDDEDDYEWEKKEDGSWIRKTKRLTSGLLGSNYGICTECHETHVPLVEGWGICEDCYLLYTLDEPGQCLYCKKIKDDLDEDGFCVECAEWMDQLGRKEGGQGR